jgi:hypothetical protein
VKRKSSRLLEKYRDIVVSSQPRYATK